MLDIEIQYWQIESDSYLSQKLNKDLIDELKNVPSSAFASIDSQAIDKWKEVGPLKIIDIYQNSKIDFSRQLEFNIITDEDEIYKGQVDASRRQHGIGRELYIDGYIYEGQFENDL